MTTNIYHFTAQVGFWIGGNFGTCRVGLKLVQFPSHSSEAHKNYVILSDPGGEPKSFQVENNFKRSLLVFDDVVGFHDECREL